MREAHGRKREVTPGVVAAGVVLSGLCAYGGITVYGAVHDYNNTTGVADKLSASDHVAPRVSYEEGCTVDMPPVDFLFTGVDSIHNPVDLGSGRSIGSHKYGYFTFDGEHATMHEFTVSSLTHLKPDGVTPGDCHEISGPLAEVYLPADTAHPRTYFAVPGEHGGDATDLIAPSPLPGAEAGIADLRTQEQELLLHIAIGQPTYKM
ncbi:MAG TPA: hypothetical protein VJP80_01725 [Candidatus Saccharimonadales bacterium]|nr:hypothetical protein [Candidatus Saccharimonadales bacterium]